MTTDTNDLQYLVAGQEVPKVVFDRVLAYRDVAEAADALLDDMNDRGDGRVSLDRAANLSKQLQGVTW